MTIQEQLRALVERFERNREAYGSSSYKEAQVRQEFINPMFKLLGWDMDNEQGYAEQYKEVVHEDAIKIGGHTKAPDYGFRIGGVTKFFLEAKKPSVDLKEASDPAFQLRRYAWTGKLPVSILTDFEEFIVYDTRVLPKKTDKPTTARIKYYKYTDYVSAWDEITGIFSKDAVLKGSFDKYADTNRAKKGTAEVDDEFLKEIEEWRRILAQNIALRNQALTQRELNFVVQRTIDRIVFLRICEDRGIEEYGRLQMLRQGSGVYSRLLKLFQNADERYNSGLFHFRREKDRSEAPDELSQSVEIDDKVLKEILGRLYYPDSPYEFSVLPAEILGNVYEQFLGSVITLDSRHRATIEQKPEVRKAGGVYYTPDYIVKRIVETTVGRWLEGKSPGPRSGVNKLKVLDPACGSGSFLIGAYQFLLDWHRTKYVEDGPEKHKKELYEGPGGDWRLTTDERKRILLNNIHGVDIDSQAVEVTKLSLLLKVLEGENQETIRKQLKLFQERALPDLGRNIKCGNSLIGPEVYQGQQSLLTDDEQYRINAFDWATEFPEIMSAGGFDVVIGNPPYIRIQAMTEWAPVEVEFYKKQYQSAGKGNFDIYVVFVERGLQLLRKGGRLGMILPHKFFNAQYGENLRALIAKGRNLAEIVHFGDAQVFDDATTYTCLLFLDSAERKLFHVAQVSDLMAWRLSGVAIEGDVSSDQVTAADWNFVVGSGADLFERLGKFSTHLEDVTDRIFQGIKTGADKVFIVRRLDERGSLVKIRCPEDGAEYEIEKELLHPLIKGGDSRRFRLTKTDRMIIFPYAAKGSGSAQLIEELSLKSRYPKTAAYLQKFRKELEARDRGKLKGPSWFGYSRNQALEVIGLPKLFTPDIAARAAFSLDADGEIFFTGGVSGGYGILVKAEYSREYVLGVLNSKLLEWCIRQTATQMRGGYYSYESRYIRHLPIVLPQPGVQASLAALVREAIRLRDEAAKALTPQTQSVVRRQSESIDHQIDKEVYSIYGLNSEEIHTVEEAFSIAQPTGNSSDSMDS